MDKQELEAKLVYEDHKTRFKALEEFEQLRPTWKTYAWRFCDTFIVFAIILFFYPETLEQPGVYLLLLLWFITNVKIHSENERINNRLDALYKLLKSDD